MIRLVFTLTFIMGLLSCSKEATTPTPDTSGCDSSLTYDANIKSIVEASSPADGNCKGCHAAQGATSLGSLSDFQANRASVLARLESTSSGTVMPQGHSEFKDTTAGKNMIAWASCSTLK